MKELLCANCNTTFVPKWKPKANKSGLNFCCQQCSTTYLGLTRTKSGPAPQGRCLTCKTPIISKFKRCTECRAKRLSEEDIDRISLIKANQIHPTQDTPVRQGVKCICCPNIISQGNTTGVCRDCFQKAERLKILKTPIKNFLYRNKGATNQYTRFREFSRRLAFEAIEQPSCSICGYSTFVEVCHIKPISSFADDALIQDVNSLTNLTFLCPNHHKEFDKALTDIKPVSIKAYLNKTTAPTS